MTCLNRFFSIFFLSIVFLFCSKPLFAANDWTAVAPGIDYRDLSGNYRAPWSHIHVFRISLQKNTIENIMASEFSKKLASVDAFIKHTNALLAINGGFFDNQSHPLGLRISNYKKQNSIKPISWWGVFYIQNKKPRITSFREFHSNDKVEFAIQAGPRLLIHGDIPSLKPGLAERTALAITKNKQLLILVTENAPMTTHELATLLKSPPLSCTDALNLDGGSSTQLSVNFPGFIKKVHGFTGVSDAVIVKSR